jgi:hypothetical protein
LRLAKKRARCEERYGLGPWGVGAAPRRVRCAVRYLYNGPGASAGVLQSLRA